MKKPDKEIMQNTLIIINKALCRLNGGINKDIRYLVVFLCCLLLSGIYFFGIGYTEDVSKTMMYGSILFAIIAFAGAEETGFELRWNIMLLIPLISFGICILIISFIHEVEPGYVVFALDILLLFPIMYYVWVSNGKYNLLLRMIAISNVFEGIITFLLCLALSITGKLGIQDDRAMGHTTNPNFLGILGLIMIMSGLFILYDKKKNAILRIASAFAIGGGLSYIFLSSSRTALIASAGCILVFVIFMIKGRQLRIPGNELKMICSIITVGILALFVGLHLTDINAHMSDQNPSVASQHVDEGTDADKETKDMRKRLSLTNDMNTFTSGRTFIWKIYIQNFSLLGKDIYSIKDEFVGVPEWRAHNNMIDYCLRFGVPVGIIYIFFYVAVMFNALKKLFKKEFTSNIDLFIVEIVGCYGVYSLIEIATMTFIRAVPFMFFLSLGIIMVEKQPEKSFKKESSHVINNRLY